MEADVIISVPVMKTHDQTEVTLSLKNLKGLVTDAEKRRIHQLGVFEGVCDLNGLFCSSFAVVDGITAQEGLATGALQVCPIPTHGSVSSFGMCGYWRHLTTTSWNKYTRV